MVFWVGQGEGVENQRTRFTGVPARRSRSSQNGQKNVRSSIRKVSKASDLGLSTFFETDTSPRISEDHHPHDVKRHLRHHEAEQWQPTITSPSLSACVYGALWSQTTHSLASYPRSSADTTHTAIRGNTLTFGTFSRRSWSVNEELPFAARRRAERLDAASAVTSVRLQRDSAAIVSVTAPYVLLSRMFVWYLCPLVSTHWPCFCSDSSGCSSPVTERGWGVHSPP